MSREPSQRRSLDTPLTVLGYLFLGLGVWFLWLGVGILVYWLRPTPDDALQAPGWVVWLTPVGALIYASLGSGFVAIWWWLSGYPIRRWWWQRTGRAVKKPPSS